MEAEIPADAAIGDSDGDGDGGASGNRFGVPEHLLERSRAARARFGT